LADVLFSYFSKIQDDHEQINRVIKKVLIMMMVVVFPFLLCIIIDTEIFVSILFGKQWSDASAYLKIFMYLTLINLLGTFAPIIYLSQGRTDLQLKYGVVTKTVTMLIIFFCSKLGTLYMAKAILYTSFFTLLIHIYLSGKLIKLELIKFLLLIFQYLFVLIITSFLITYCMDYIKYYLLDYSGLIYFLILCMLFYSVFYLILLLIKKFPLDDFKSLIRLIRVS